VDRLPQLINVLRGEMSIVGPAPVAAGDCDESRVRHLRRFETEPGMTGLSELRNFGEPLPGSYISTDEIYRSSWSPLLDIAIVARSLYAVVGGAGCRGAIDREIARG
jgi:exopolysaccharide production protein ExoY